MIERGIVRVEVAEFEVLLAMKLRACRPQKDLAHLAFLLRRCDVRTVDEEVGFLVRYYPEEELSERDKSTVQAAQGEIELPTRPLTLLPPVDPRPAPPICRHWVLKKTAIACCPSSTKGAARPSSADRPSRRGLS